MLASRYLLALICVGGGSASAADPTYWNDVRPILRKNCTVCHSERKLSEPEVSAGLALLTLHLIENPVRFATPLRHSTTSGLPAANATAYLPPPNRSRACSGREGLNLTGASPVVPMARFRYVAIPQFVVGNHTFSAWCKRPGCPEDFALLR